MIGSRLSRWFVSKSRIVMGIIILGAVLTFAPVLVADETCGVYALTFQGVHDAFQGQFHDVNIEFQSSDSESIVTGFNLLLTYNPNALHLQDVHPGTMFDGVDWDYFETEWESSDTCRGQCPQSFIRIRGKISSCNSDGISAPSSENFLRLLFLLTNDRTYECQFTPVQWYWQNCDDNVLNLRGSRTQLVSRKVFDLDCIEYYCTEITDQTAGFPTLFGAQDNCFESGGHHLRRQVDFHSGGVEVRCSGISDPRGDINLNGLAYEIADFNMLLNYFLIGLEAFGSHVVGSLEESDVNEDSIFAHVSDLVYLRNVTVGDVNPYPPDVGPVSSDVVLRHSVSDSGHQLDLVSTDTLGGIALKIAGEVTPQLLQSEGELQYHFDGTITRVVASDLDFFDPVAWTSGPLVSWEPVSTSTGTGSMQDVQVSSVKGGYRTVFLDGTTAAGDEGNLSLPGKFSLAQNYPNPFNPSTDIAFTLPKSSHICLTVYNSVGQRITTLVDETLSAGEHHVTWYGRDNSGQSVASGIYFYRITADDLSATKKMLLLK